MCTEFFSQLSLFLRNLGTTLLVVSTIVAYTTSTVSCCVSLVDVKRRTQASLRYLVNITSLYGNHCASFNRNQAAFTILYYGTSSPP